MIYRRHIYHILVFPAILPVTFFASCSFEEGEPDSTVISQCLLFPPADSSSFFSDSTYTFIYDNRGELDSYQSDAVNSGTKLEFASRSGTKTVVIIANVGEKQFCYNDIQSLNNIMGMQMSFSCEIPEKPVSSCRLEIQAGPRETHSAKLVPLMSKVRLRSLTVDFSDRPYRNATLDNPRAYLINVNGRCSIIPGRDSVSTDIINHGHFDEIQTKSIACPGMLFSPEPAESVFYCYPCDGRKDEFPDRRATRLVIEGEICGTTCYYAINVGHGLVERGKEYIYDVRITRIGSDDPDSPVENTVAEIVCTTVEWNEYDNEIEKF